MKVLMITATDYDDSEVLYPYYRLVEEGYDIDVASFEKGSVYGKYHFVIEANKTFDDIVPSEYDALVLPGGKAPEKLRQNEKCIEAVRYFFSKSLPVCAICHGQQILISAKVLQGKTATCYPGIKDDLTNAGAKYADDKVVVDGNLVTSRRPDDLPYFMKEFIELLKGIKND